PPGASTSQARGIKLEGVIVGSYDTDSGAFGFIDNHGHYTTLSDPNGVVTSATGINAFGTVIGDYGVTTGFSAAFVYDHGTYTTIEIDGAHNTMPRTSTTLASL